LLFAWSVVLPRAFIWDNPEEGRKSAMTSLQLVLALEKLAGEGVGLVDAIAEVVEVVSRKKEKEHGVKVLYQVCYL
jgi:hypothetical protein